MSPTVARSTRIALRALAPTRIAVQPIASAARWHTTGPTGHPFVRHLRTLPYPVNAPPVTVVVLDETWTPDATGALLRALPEPDAGQQRAAGRVVLVHSGAGGGSLLRGLAAQHAMSATSIELLESSPAALCTAAGLLGHPPYAGDDLTVAADGSVSTVGWRPIALPVAVPDLRGAPVLVTGGLGGLGVRMAARLAHRGAVPVLVDVRSPGDVPGDTRRYLAELRRLAPGTRVIQVDLTDGAAAARRLAGLRPQAIVHCAGRIAGGTGRWLDAAQIQALVASKVDTLRHAIAVTGSRALRAVLTFGSVTAHGAHPGLSGYALANELLRRETARLAARYPSTAWCTAEWSLWSGAGMARGVARGAARQLGMVPVPVGLGITAAVRVLADLIAPGGRPLPGNLLIAGWLPGAEGRWAGRPEGLPGIDAALVVPPGADLDKAMLAVAEAAAAGLDLVPRNGTYDGTPLLVRATVRGDQVDCLVQPASGHPGAALRHDRYRIIPER